ncbi:MAG TPA: carboxypeptidase-like regulatory domain-containing protein [Polyangiaceae bacterium]|nr:carboxypeptidase-like regulatory domain-containing protein [Polyangiaceae bacterium]
MRLAPLLALVGFGTLASGCIIVGGESTSERGCGLVAGDTGNTNPDVIVLDEDGDGLCGARVVARDGAFESTLTPTSGACHHFEMPPRVGSYEVTIEHDDYQTFVARSVRSAGLSSCLGPGGVVARLKPVEPACDASALMSFQVDLRDENGAPVCDAAVTVRDGAFAETLRPSTPGDGTCSWVGPTERPGTYEVTISKPGYETIVMPSVVVAKEPSGCHVVPAKVNAQLVPEPAGCTDIAITAFTLDVFDELGDSVCDASVTVRDGDFEQVLDEPSGQCTWVGPFERAGIYDITVTRPGYLPAVLEDVVVTSDACHVKTVPLAVTLTPEGPPPAGG